VPTAEVTNGRPLRVLVVDDQPDIADSEAMLVRLWGYEAETARDGLAALAAAARFRPDVVVLDIGLPGMNGWELARRLRESVGPLCLIAVTGYATDADRRRSAEAGFESHLAKPADPEELHGLIQTYDQARRRSG
jgi:CheY-like chemotaxis protein